MNKSWSVPEPPPLQPAISGLDYEGLLRCIHCGFCAQSCPTYRETGLETLSPRGRITLMRALAEEKLPLDTGLAEPLDLCLGCRACESACPSGVQYGRLLEEARALTAPLTPPSSLIRLGMSLMPHPGLLRAAGWLGALAQRLGLFRLMPGPAGDLARALPPIRPARSYRAAGASPHTAASAGTGSGTGDRTVLFFRGCVQDAFLFHQNEAAVRVLVAAGARCIVPPGQVCCGALHAHNGDLETARQLARQNIAAFERYPGPIVTHAGGCGAHLKEYAHLLRDDPDWAERARTFASRVVDFSEWLAEVGLPEGSLSPLPLTVTYQDSCHLAHAQKVRRQPRDLIRAIPGIRYREMDRADQCCGSAGIYNMVHPEMAGRILQDKMARVARTGAQVVVTANPGCYLQLRLGVRQPGLSGQVEILTLAELLDCSLQGRLPTVPGVCSTSPGTGARSGGSGGSDT